MIIFEPNSTSRAAKIKIENCSLGLCAYVRLCLHRHLNHAFIHTCACYNNDVFGLMFRVDFSTVSLPSFRASVILSIRLFGLCFPIFFVALFHLNASHTLASPSRSAASVRPEWGDEELQEQMRKKDRIISLWIFYTFSKRFCVCHQTTSSSVVISGDVGVVTAWFRP